jgi:Inorganic pyrophosphatase
MNIDAIAIGTNPPEDVNVIIEVPIGGEPIKYEMDKAAGTLVVDRFLHTPMRYPGNYALCRIRCPMMAIRSMFWSQTPGPSCLEPS